jgi:hypothetical protein
MSKRVAGPEIERLIQLLAKLPGLGPRSARRAALHLVKKRESLMQPLTAAMAEALEMSPTSGRWSAPGRSMRSTMSSAARCRRSTASARRTSTSRAW